MQHLGALGIFVSLVALGAVFGAQFEPGPWYEGLRKPPLNTPNWIFGPVWSVLYLGIAVAGWLVWRARPKSAKPLALWGSQLVLNAAWSLLFFGLQLPGLALVEIFLLLALLFASTVSFFRVRPLRVLAPLSVALPPGRLDRRSVIGPGGPACSPYPLADYQRTQFGGWPWPAADPVHGRNEGRFARHADGRVERPDE